MPSQTEDSREKMIPGIFSAGGSEERSDEEVEDLGDNYLKLLVNLICYGCKSNQT